MARLVASSKPFNLLSLGLKIMEAKEDVWFSINLITQGLVRGYLC